MLALSEVDVRNGSKAGRSAKGEDAHESRNAAPS
jgi:hypothetical protein